MTNKDKMILNKIIDYCKEIDNTHNVFKRNIDLFFDKESGYQMIFV